MDDIEGAGILQKMSTVHLDSLFFGKHGYTYVAFSFPLVFIFVFFAVFHDFMKLLIFADYAKVL